MAWRSMVGALLHQDCGPDGGPYFVGVSKIVNVRPDVWFGNRFADAGKPIMFRIVRTNGS